MTNDQINGLFELVGSLFILNHCWTLFCDKIVKGVSLMSTFYFFSWGIWNLFWYPSLGQPYSFYGGIAIMIANVIWIAMMIYYKIKNFSLFDFQGFTWLENIKVWYKVFKIRFGIDDY
jgi:hypothetical protein